MRVLSFGSTDFLGPMILCYGAVRYLQQHPKSPPTKCLSPLSPSLMVVAVKNMCRHGQMSQEQGVLGVPYAPGLRTTCLESTRQQPLTILTATIY